MNAQQISQTHTVDPAGDENTHHHKYRIAGGAQRIFVDLAAGTGLFLNDVDCKDRQGHCQNPLLLREDGQNGNTQQYQKQREAQIQ